MFLSSKIKAAASRRSKRPTKVRHAVRQASVTIVNERAARFTSDVGISRRTVRPELFTAPSILGMGLVWTAALLAACWPTDGPGAQLVALAVASALLCLCLEMSRGRFNLERPLTVLSVASSIGLAFVAGCALSALSGAPITEVWRRGLLAASIVTAGEIGYVAVRAFLLKAGRIGVRIAVVGPASPDRSRVVDYLERSPAHVIAATFEPEDTTGLTAAAEAGRFDAVVVAVNGDMESAELVARSLLATAVDVAFCINPSCLVRWAHPVQLSDALVQVQHHRQRGWRMIIKRGVDIFGAMLALLLLSIPLLLIAVAIRLESSGPAIFKQQRYGYRGQPFVIWKFRSMRNDASDPTGARLTSRNDDRVTRVGAFIRRTSFDELPQLVNILIGDLSFVGPRPHPSGAKAAGALYDDLIPQFKARYRARPGLTGLAQCSGLRGNTDTEQKLFDRFDADMYYVENWSLSLDAKILLRTIGHLLNPKNAF